MRAPFLLPPLTRSHHFFGSAVVMTVITLSYLVSSRWQVAAPLSPGWGRLDGLVPHIPLAGLVYISHYLLIAVGLLFLRWPERDRLLWRMVLALTAALVVFQLFPVELPRSPLPRGFPLARVCREVFALDSPFNTFPSLHAAFALLTAGALRRQEPRAGAAFLAWGWAVVASTLLAKRHFVPDAAAGVLLAAACERLVPSRLDVSGAERAS